MSYRHNISIIMAIFSLYLVSGAYADSVGDALKAALQGPERKKLKLFKHEFNIKPVKIDSEGGITIIEGEDNPGGRDDHHISHHLTWRPDDQVSYTIVKEHGIVTDIQKRINRGGWTSIIAPLAPVVGAYFGVSISAETVEEVGQALGRIIDGSWESEADYLIAQIAFRVDLGMEVGMDRPGMDYQSFDLPDAQPTSCQKACGDDPVCKAWTYVQPGIQGEYARCWLKYAVPAPQPSTFCSSGVMRALPQ